MNILFVCTGNICRSPMAVAIARNAIIQADHEGVEVASAGTYALHGSAATSDAVIVTEENGLSLAAHRARQLTPELLATADLVVGMQPEHVEHARRLGAEQATIFSTPVPDPYGLGLGAYRETWVMLSSMIPLLLRENRSKL